ncbi:ATP-dependent helicase [Clostridium perfringens]|uniref:ATP-dependent helicase n=1 Tax=Clostridium perfringens TaxID=1502 RepID=UPI002341795A|nr:ATP-dependent helicase [Clostridium perfringens]MDC4245544.1 ATP-dependent helicase [Clostridium perfringens]
MSKIKFNNQQKEVINFKEGAVCVLAAAGSGKTACIINRIKKLVEDGVKQDSILSVTFTNNSSSDLRKKLKKENLEDVQVGTFHAVSKRILMSEGIDVSKQLPVYEVENIFKRIDKKAKCKEIMSYISLQKVCGNGVMDIKEDSESYTVDELRTYYKAYEDYKQSKKAYDFTDWMLKAIEILKSKRGKFYTVDYILVDEQQDNDIIQNKLIDLLCPSGNIAVVGDVRQSIYKFKGASPELFMNFDKRYKDATILNMDINYRSCKNIVEGANNFIKKYLGGFKYYSDSIANNENDGYINKVFSLTKEEEAERVVNLVSKDIENGIKPSDIAILYRLNKQSFYIENELKNNGIDYHIEANNNFFERKEVKAIVCMLRLLQDPSDDGAYEYLYKLRCHPFSFMSNHLLSDIIDLAAKKDISLLDASTMYIGSAKTYERRNLDNFMDIYNSLLLQKQKGKDLLTIINNIIKLFRLQQYIEEHYEGDELDERLESLNAVKSFVRNNTLESFLRFIYTSETTKKKTKSNEVQLMTVHKSKGLEFKKVYILVNDNDFPSKKALEGDNLDEEARVFYVGVTRAKESLVLSCIGNQSLFIDQYFN